MADFRESDDVVYRVGRTSRAAFEQNPYDAVLAMFSALRVNLNDLGDEVLAYDTPCDLRDMLNAAEALALTRVGDNEAKALRP